jgi:hypothetical protein
MMGFGATMSAFMYKGARAVTEGREPSASTDRARRRPSRLARPWGTRPGPGADPE